MSENWLICGTRKKGYKELVFSNLDTMYFSKQAMASSEKGFKPNSIIEGCCNDSADVYAEEWAKLKDVPIQHHPSTSGNYLKRNIEMIKKASLVIAFWDGYSYGTAHTIAQAVMRNIPVKVINLKEQKII